MAKVRQKQRQTNTTRFLEAPFVRMLRMRSASLKRLGFSLLSQRTVVVLKSNKNSDFGNLISIAHDLAIEAGIAWSGDATP